MAFYLEISFDFVSIAVSVCPLAFGLVVCELLLGSRISLRLKHLFGDKGILQTHPALGADSSH